jgi:hypothetical protein
VNSAVYAINGIVLALIYKIGRAAERELLVEAFRGRSLTSVFGLVSLPEKNRRSDSTIT